MQLKERLQLWTTLLVVGTTLVVGSASLVWGQSPRLVVAQVGAGLLVLVVAHLGLRLLIGPTLDHPEILEQQIRRISSTPDSVSVVSEAGPDLASVVAAVNALIAGARAREAQLGHQVRGLAEVLERSPTGVLITDDEGRITFANGSLRAMFRLRGEPVGRLPVEAVPVVEVHGLVQAGLQGVERDVELSTSDSDYRVGSQILVDGRVVIRIEDVTGVREAERSRADFVANVSHELRTPITALMGYAETLMMDADSLPDDARPLIATIERNAFRLRDLFEDLLKLHRIEARRHELPLTVLPLEPLIGEATETAIDLALKKGTSFEVSCEPGVTGLVNPEALVAMVSNLVTNAVRYTPDGGRVEVHASTEGDLTRISVVDDGIGIPETQHERVWERFYRVDEARSRAVGGTGLGLAIVKHFALACRAQVRLSSREGHGSRFTVELPRE